MITTTHGRVEESLLLKTVGFEDRPREFVVWVEWRLPTHGGAPCYWCDQYVRDNAQAVDIDRAGAVLVRRDAHVILKDPMSPKDELVGVAGDVHG